MNGQPGQLAQFRGEGLSFRGLRADFAGEMYGVAHNDSRHPKSPAEPGQRAQILTPIVSPLERENRLRRQPQLVRHSHTDATIADIEAEIARMGYSFQLMSSWLLA